MSAKELQDLLNFIAGSGLDEVNIEGNDFKISVKRHSESKQQIVAQPIVSQVPVMPAIVQQQVAPAQPAPMVEAKVEKPVESNAGKYVTIKSPMIGTFYRSSSPDKPSLVSIGDEVNSGKVVCIIEAMKLFNEIESEIAGKIVKVLVENASPVEYDQDLFVVEVA